MIGADVQGATMLAETLAQYSALMVMEKEYGRDKMRRFLKYELDRYLAGRGGELVEGAAADAASRTSRYIHYRKGSLVMYALRDEIGEDNVNARAAPAHPRPRRSSSRRTPTTRDLIADFRAVTPPEQQSLIDRPLRDDHALRQQGDDGDGREARRTASTTSRHRRVEEVPRRRPRQGDRRSRVNDWIDIGVLGASKTKGNEPVLALEKHHLTTPKATFESSSPRSPTAPASIRYNKLVDRNPDDNTKKVE